MSTTPRAVTRWTPRIECSRPEYGRSLLRASVLFALLLGGQVALITQLVYRDLSRQHIVSALLSYREDLQQIQRRIDEIMKEEGKYDLYALREKLTVLTRVVNDRFAKQLAIDHLAVYDVQGRRVVTLTGMRRALVPVRPSASPQPAPPAPPPGPPEFRKQGEMPDGEASPSPGGNALEGLRSGLDPARPETDPSRRLFTGAGQPDSEPAASDGDPSGESAPAESDATRSTGERSLAPVADSAPVGPPVPPGAVHMDSATRETLIVVPVGTTAGSGTGAARGTIELGVNRELLESEAGDVQRDLMRKLAAGAFLSLVLLVVGFLYVLKLLQKTRRLEAEAQMADRLAYIGTLASGLAHEIRNPLNAMNKNLQMIEEEMAMSGEPATLPGPHPEPVDDDTRSLLESTRGEIKRLERLVSNFLAYARPSTPHVEERDLNQAVEDLVRFLKVELSSGGIEVETHFDPDLPAVVIDETQFKQAILNILVNARQVLGPGGRIELGTGRTLQGEIFVRIADNGPGIPADQMDKIFEVFYSNRRGGTGLGLPIAQRIVQNHGGRIEVESEAGQGTTFTIILPPEPRTSVAPAPAPEVARIA